MGSMDQRYFRCGNGFQPSQGSNTWLLPIPAAFVVGTDGEVKSRFLDPDYRKRVAVEELIAALKADRAFRSSQLDTEGAVDLVVNEAGSGSGRRTPSSTHTSIFSHARVIPLGSRVSGNRSGLRRWD